jgi:hypothetical protein
MHAPATTRSHGSGARGSGRGGPQGRKRQAAKSRKVVEDGIYLRLTDDPRTGEDQASRDAFGAQSFVAIGKAAGPNRSQRGQLNDTLLYGMEFGYRQSGQFCDDFTRAHGLRIYARQPVEESPSFLALAPNLRAEAVGAVGHGARSTIDLRHILPIDPRNKSRSMRTRERRETTTVLATLRTPSIFHFPFYTP